MAELTDIGNLLKKDKTSSNLEYFLEPTGRNPFIIWDKTLDTELSDYYYSGVLDTAFKDGQKILEREQYLNQKKFEAQGFVTQENWKNELFIQARVVQYNEDSVTLECLIDKESKVFELREFDYNLFSHLDKLDVGMPIMIKTLSKPGALRVDILNGEKLIDPSLFELEDLFDEIEGKGLDKPFFG